MTPKCHHLQSQRSGARLSAASAGAPRAAARSSSLQPAASVTNAAHITPTAALQLHVIIARAPVINTVVTCASDTSPPVQHHTGISAQHSLWYPTSTIRAPGGTLDSHQLSGCCAAAVLI